MEIPKIKESCHVCGELAVRVYRGYPLCPFCDRMMDEIISITEDAPYPGRTEGVKPNGNDSAMAR